MRRSLRTLSVLQGKEREIIQHVAAEIVIFQHGPRVAPFRRSRIRSHTCVLCVYSRLVLAEPPDICPASIASPSSRLGNAKRAESKFRKRADATDSDEASFQITKHLRLVLSIDMLVWFETLRPTRNGET